MKLKKVQAMFLLIIVIFIVLQIFKGPFPLIRKLLGTSNIIVIDAGHGGKDPGTIGINNSYEKDINLDISKKLYDKLKSLNYKVILTRNKDEFIENTARANMANRKRARTFVSIHCNSLENNNSTNGVQVLYYPDKESNSDGVNSKLLAQIVLDKILASTGANNKGIVEREDLIVLNQTNMPAIIVECGFLSNKTEADLLSTDKYQNKIVNAVIDGLEDYFNY